MIADNKMYLKIILYVYVFIYIFLLSFLHDTIKTKYY